MADTKIEWCERVWNPGLSQGARWVGHREGASIEELVTALRKAPLTGQGAWDAGMLASRLGKFSPELQTEIRLTGLIMLGDLQRIQTWWDWAMRRYGLETDPND